MTELPDWLTPLPDARSMAAIDRWAIEERGVPGIELMERAGAGVAAALERLRPDGPVAVLCGKGNNGGDGLVVARLLREAGRPVSVICIGPPQELRGDAAENLTRLPGAGPLRLDGTSWGGEGAGGGAEGALASAGAADATIVDGLLGTGFQGAPRGEVGEAIEQVNRREAVVLSIDVPSGVDASSGEVPGAAVRAKATVTFHRAKPGLWINPGKALAGAVQTLDIGIPRGAPEGAAIGLIEPRVLHRLPRRDAAASKFTSGRVLVLGGSRGLSGAPAMSARASMRAGAGYVTVCVPSSLQPVLAACGTPEMMTRGLAEADGGLSLAAVEEALAEAERGGAMVLGPGLGRGEEALALARELAGSVALPLVLDADGLNAHAGALAALRGREAATILTPHAGELARLLGGDSATVQRERLGHARLAAERSGAIVVLKGDDTVIASPAGLVAVSPGDSPALATAGTGDVLSGVIAALLAQGLDGFTAACAGVHLHAAAGREAALRLGAAEGVIASDVIESLPAARAAGGRVERDA